MRASWILVFRAPTFVNFTECATAEFLNHTIALVKYLLTFNKHLLINYFKGFKLKKQYLFEETTRVVSNLKMLILYRSNYDAIINNLLNFKNKF